MINRRLDPDVQLNEGFPAEKKEKHFASALMYVQGVCREVRSIGEKKNDAASTCVVEQKDVNRLDKELKSFLLLFFSRDFFSYTREKDSHRRAQFGD